MAKRLIAESGVQLLARLTARPSLLSLDRNLFPDDLVPGDIVQISGQPGTGKSFLLLHLLTKCLLPKSYKNVEIGGLGAGAILIDTDHNISILKLATLMEQFVVKSVKHDERRNPVEIFVEEILQESLNRLIILKTYSSMQLQMNFHSLVKILSTNKNIALLVIDSLTSYYWDDTLNVKNFKKMDLYLKVMIDTLQKCIKDFKIITIFVKQDYFQSKRGGIKLPEITHKVHLRKSGETNDLFHAFIGSQQSNCQFSISDIGFTWVVN